MSDDRPLTERETQALLTVFHTVRDAGIPVPADKQYVLDWKVGLKFSSRNVLDRANLGAVVSSLMHQNPERDAFQIIVVTDDDLHPLTHLVLFDPAHEILEQSMRASLLLLARAPWISRGWYLHCVTPRIRAWWQDMEISERVSVIADSESPENSVLDEAPPPKVFAILERALRDLELEVTEDDDGPDVDATPGDDAEGYLPDIVLSSAPPPPETA